MTKIVRGPVESKQSYRNRVKKEQMMQDVIAAETLEDLKIVLLDWIDDNSIRRHIPAAWDR